MENFQKIADLIDADNTQLTKLEAVLHEVSTYGRIVVKKAYGNWRKDSLKNWESELKRLAIRAEQQFDYVTGKNTTDIAMVIGAMDLLHTNMYDALVLVSSDSDFTPLAIRLRESGLYIIGLFISVAGLEQTGVLKLIAQFISSISGGSIKAVIVIILLLSAVCSALIDNIPFAATMVPVIQSIAATQGMDLRVIAWALSLGTDLGGNATPIGASANVVATSVSAKSGHPISWGKYCKYCVPATVLVIAVSLGCLFLRYL